MSIVVSEHYSFYWVSTSRSNGCKGKSCMVGIHWWGGVRDSNVYASVLLHTYKAASSGDGANVDNSKASGCEFLLLPILLNFVTCFTTDAINHRNMSTMINHELENDFFRGGTLHRKDQLCWRWVASWLQRRPHLFYWHLCCTVPAALPVNGILDLYRFGHPTRLYLNLKADVPVLISTSLHEKQFEVKHQGVTVLMEELERERKKWPFAGCHLRPLLQAWRNWSNLKGDVKAEVSN